MSVEPFQEILPAIWSLLHEPSTTYVLYLIVQAEAGT